MDAGGLAHSNYSNPGGNSAPGNGIGAPGMGFGARSRLGGKRLSVALPPNVDTISETNPTPRTSRSHLLAGLRTQPKMQIPASAPYNHLQHAIPGMGPRACNTMAVPQSAMTAGFGVAHSGFPTYAMAEQILAPPAMLDSAAEMDPLVLQQMQITRSYLAKRQQELQQQLDNLSLSHSTAIEPTYACLPPMDISGQSGVYLMWNPASQSYMYAVDPNMSMQVTSPSASVTTGRSVPRKNSTSPSAQFDPLPSSSANSFGRSHKKGSSLAINPFGRAEAGPQTASPAAVGSQRSASPPTPMTGTFAPGAARAGEHPVRQPRGPPAIDELLAAPTAAHVGSKNFAARQRRQALANLAEVGAGRRGVSRSSETSRDSDDEDKNVSEVKDKNGPDSYCGLSSASSSESEDLGPFRQPPTPAAPNFMQGMDRKTMLGVLSAAGKRRSVF
ncbi:hypothetical protein K470DRAFT_272644 [Piedraia hortae CBS 480.64]|uniref:Uncharacterized protein n=1 Tax=Piedraia hortae CBS 480.64 TaxID=1314780 RepID=A0A6A7BU22_9PEZI|nr:hypothetical protein K470DRAFT_272644 [Piedraia hortae CBS 480.64]